MSGELSRAALASVLVGSVVLAAVWLGGVTVLRRRPGVRHLLLNAALLVYLLGPLWILAARVLPEGARQVMQPAARALAFLDAVETRVPSTERQLAPGGVSQRGPGVRRAGGGPWVAGVWALGSGVLFLRLARGWRRVRRLRLAAAAPDPDLAAWAGATLRERFPGRALPAIRISAAVGSPLVVGALRPVILLPASALALDRAQLAHVLVHEMGHVLRGDLRAGLLHRITAALHWPNPLVHLCRRALERAQEESCDDLVVSAAARPADYARTLLAVATSEDRPLGAGALGMAVRPGELERRIRRLLEAPAPGQPAPAPRKPARVVPPRLAPLVTLVVTALGGAAVAGAVASAGAVPGAAAAPVNLAAAATGLVNEPAPTPPSPAPPGTADEAAARALFRDAGPSVDGAFVLIDVATGAVRAVNPGLAAASFTPVSTYKVPIAIAALETGALLDEHAVAKWNGQPHEIAAWNRDLDLHAAMKVSSNWYFEQLYHRVGEASMRAWTGKLRFGTPAGPGDAQTWIDGGLTITPLQLAGFFARFAAGTLPVSARTQEILRRVLVIEERAGVTLRAKTGTAALGTGGTLGWLAGTVEHPGGRSHAFATFFRGSRADQSGIAQRRHAITRRLLARFRALPGEMAP